VRLEQGWAEENKKPSGQRVLGGSQKTFWETQQLFSSFLRGASRPKSPREAATAAAPFMQESKALVKSDPGVETNQGGPEIVVDNKLTVLCVK
jgi:hypothetical protein